MLRERERRETAARQPPEPRNDRRRRPPAWAALLALVGISALLRGWAGRAVPSPWFTPDEIVYAELGRSLYRLGRFEILGGAPDFYGLVYPAFIGLPLSLADVGLGYGLLKALQAVVMSLAAVPVYLWGRRMMSAGWALVAAALTLALPALAFTGFIMTEVVFYPVLCLAAWAMAATLARPTLTNQALLVGAIVLAALTRLQAVVLVPALLLAVALKAVFERSWLRGTRPLAPALGALGLIGAGWIGVSVLRRGEPLGAYGVTGEASYGVWDTVRFALYHAADLLLLTAVLPVVALALLAVAALAGRERSPEARAFLAVTLALSIVFVAAVGVFASRWVGRLAERNLIALAPLLFLAFALWADRGAPRPPVTTALAALGALALLLFVPWREFVVSAAEPDAFSVIPLYELHVAYPELGVEAFVVIAAVELLAVFAFLPRRLLWLLPAVLLLVLGSSSIWVSDVVARQARTFKTAMVGNEPRWIDRAATGPVAYLYGGELVWSAGAPVWTNLFWNDRIDRAYRLVDTPIAGPMLQSRVALADDGRVLLGAKPASADNVVASTEFAFAGERLATSVANLALWRVDPPLRVLTRTTGLNLQTSTLDGAARVRVFACRPGEVRLTLVSEGDQAIDLWRNGAPLQRVALRAGQAWTGTIPARLRGAAGRSTCSFEIVTESRLRVDRIEFVPT